MQNLLPIVTLVSGILMTILILAQARGASLGAGFGGSSELYTERRGVDKTIYQITIITSVVFVLSILLTVISG